MGNPRSGLSRALSRVLLVVYWTQSTLALAVMPPASAQGRPIVEAAASDHRDDYGRDSGRGHDGHDRDNDEHVRDHDDHDRDRDDGQHRDDPHAEHGHHDDSDDDDGYCEDDRDDDHHDGHGHEPRSKRSCRDNVKDGKVPGTSVAKRELWPADHKLVNVGLRIDLGEACCGKAGVTVAVYSDEPADGTGSGDQPIDAVIAAPDLYLREERSGSGNGRVYLIAATATYDGISSTRCTTVVVPKSQRQRDRDSAKRQACAARAYCGLICKAVV